MSINELVGAKVGCGICNNEFVVEEGREIVYYPDDSTRFLMICPKCGNKVDFVAIDLKC